MSKYGDEGTTTGQAFRVKTVQTIATALPMPVVTEDDIKKKDHPINLEHLSGKQKGAMVVVEKTNKELYIAIARGSSPTDIWDVTTMEASPVTPGE